MSITREDVRAHRAELEEALAEFCAKHNLDMKQGNISFSNTSFSVKLEFVERAEGPGGVNVNTPEAKAYLGYGHSYGLLPGKLGAKFFWGGKEYTFLGINQKRPQYPFDVLRYDGKKFKMPVSVASNINAGEVK